MNDVEAFEIFENGEALQDRVKRVVAFWGGSFAEAAKNPRFEFEGTEIRIRLWKTVKISGEESQVITMVEPTLNDLEKLDNVRGNIAQTRRLIVSCCSITDREAGALGMRDLTMIGQLTAAFTSAAPETGSTF